MHWKGFNAALIILRKFSGNTAPITRLKKYEVELITGFGITGYGVGVILKTLNAKGKRYYVT
jgi:hypothetical protein